MQRKQKRKALLHLKLLKKLLPKVHLNLLRKLRAQLILQVSANGNIQLSSENGDLGRSFQDISKHIPYLQGEESEMTVFWSMFVESFSGVSSCSRIYLFFSPN